MALSVRLFGLCVGAAFVLFGGLYFVAPGTALALSAHTPEKLPLVMGGRYALFGGLLCAALLYADMRVLTGLLIGFAWLALVDTAIYWQADPLPHALAGVVCVLFAAYFATRRSEPAT